MAARRVGLQDVRQGGSPSRLRLLAPLRYLWIYHAEKAFYDIKLPLAIGVVGWAAYALLTPKIPLFGDAGLLRFARDLLIMAVPFMIGALASVSMGSPGAAFDRRPPGAEILLDGEVLTLRQFLCYLLGYLSFLGLLTLGAVVFAGLLHDPVVAWTKAYPGIKDAVHLTGAFLLSVLLSSLAVTVFWALFFLTDIVNRKEGAAGS